MIYNQFLVLRVFQCVMTALSVLFRSVFFNRFATIGRVVFCTGDGSAHEAESSASSPGGASSPISSPALNHQAAGAGGGSSSSGGGTGTTTTPSSNAAPATPNDSADERRARTHRSSTDESHSKTPAQVAPVKPAPIKAPSAKILQTTPSKSSTGPPRHSASLNLSLWPVSLVDLI